MNRFQVMSGAVILYCLVMVAVACYISNAAWYVWLIALGVNIGYDIAAVSQKVKVDPKAGSNKLRVYASAAKGVPVTTPSIYEWQKWCTLAAWFCIGMMGLSCTLLDTVNGLFGCVVVTSICMSVIYLCRCHGYYKTKEFYWYHGWIITMWLIMGAVACQLLDEFGVTVSENIPLALLAVALVMCLFTLGAGFKYYVWPPMKELADDIKEIYQTIRRHESGKPA